MEVVGTSILEIPKLQLVRFMGPNSCLAPPSLEVAKPPPPGSTRKQPPSGYSEARLILTATQSWQIYSSWIQRQRTGRGLEEASLATSPAIGACWAHPEIATCPAQDKIVPHFSTQQLANSFCLAENFPPHRTIRPSGTIYGALILLQISGHGSADQIAPLHPEFILTSKT